MIQPSLMEGFGLTALEAMICGAPVIAANAGALPEVVADDRALFDPTDAGQIAVLVARVCADEALRASLVERGRAQVAKFTWARTARLAVSTLREAINRRGTPLPAAANSLDLARSNVAARARQFDIDAKVKATLFAVAEPRDETTDRAPRRLVDVSGTPTVRFIRGDTVLLLDGVWDRTRGVILRKARLQGCDVVTALHDLGPLRMSGTCAPGVAATCSAGFEMALQFSTGFVCSTREVANGLIALLTAIRFPRRLRVACLDLGRADEPEWAARMSEIITGNGCYKTHVPVEEAPYGALSDLGQTVMRSALSDGDRHYDLELVEGPILTAGEQAGDTMRFVVALTNRSTTNWSSRGPDDAGLGIFLGCRVVNRRGRAAGGEIARASIPFVLPAGDRHVMAIDVASKALRRRVTALDIEVLQDRVGWFGGALRVRV